MPTGHSVQVATLPVLYRPDTHSVQLPAPALEYVPLAHAAHGVVGTDVYCPAEQVMHDVWLESTPYCPLLQTVQVDSPDVAVY